MSDNFKKYSHVYDSLNQEKDYQQECEYLVHLFEKFEIDKKIVFDFGCGTGKHAIGMALKGFNVFGVDLSEEMIDIAKQVSLNQNLEIQKMLSFEVSDVRSFRGKESRAAIYSLFHVASYQTSNQDLISYFDSAAVNLNHGGLFVIDYWYKPAVKFLKPRLKVKRVRSESHLITRISEPLEDDQANILVNFTIFVENLESGKIEKFTEAHLMRPLEEKDILSAASNNFEVLDTFEWLQETYPTQKTWNAVTILRKK